MARDRIKLQEILEGLEGLATDPIMNRPAVYFQAPPNAKMVYPCILYRKDDFYTNKANNYIYALENRYNVLVIDRDPDTKIPYQLLHSFSMISADRVYVADNLNHYSFTLYY